MPFGQVNNGSCAGFPINAERTVVVTQLLKLDLHDVNAFAMNTWFPTAFDELWLRGNNTALFGVLCNWPEELAFLRND